MSELDRRRDLICFSHLRWHFVTQRPQHLLTRAARDRRVFFFEEPFWHNPADLPQGNHLEELPQSESLTVLRPQLVHGTDPVQAQAALLAQLLDRHRITRYDTWYYTPMAFSFTRALTPEVTVYDCMDELKNFLHAPAELAGLEQELFSAADVVFTGGRSLHEAKRLQHPNVHAFPSSIDRAHFAQALAGPSIEPADQSAIPHPRAGFYGVVDERFDIALLRDVAALRPHIHFVVLGPVVKIDPASLPQAENIHYLGGRSYDDLPCYLAGWDAALLPFAINEATRFISPTKTPEYLAAGRPVVSTPVRDVVRDYGDPGLVRIASTATAFAEALDQALLPPSPEWQARVDSNLQQNSWNKTWSNMQQAMDRAASLKQTSQATTTQPATGKLPAAPDTRAPRRSGDRTLDAAAAAPLLKKPSDFDYVVVGAGFAGSVLAERLANKLGQRVLVIDKRPHIAGNAYDFHNAAGILIHQYGPHIFHTNSDAVVRYLSKFTEWRPYEHRVLASVHGKLVPVPINLRTINELYNLDLDAEGMQQFLAERVVPSANIRTSEDIVLSRVGRELYETFFRNYTRKQWGLDPSELDSSVAGRIPVRFDEDDRYFSDTFQAMPLHGYTAMFEQMLSHPNITLDLGVDFEQMRSSLGSAKVIYTGPIDEYFGFRYGPLPYRSLEFKHETHDVEQFQPVGVVNYPNDHDYTRITEFKTLTGEKNSKTSIVYEYPRASGDPYYPIPRPENAALYARYKALADRSPEVTFCGRLANYKYFNMDQVVAQALSTFDRLAANHPVAEAPTTAYSAATTARPTAGSQATAPTT